jgi:adenylyltransferase/sulfurtransferase
MPLEHDEILRYSRHLTLPQVGLEGQQRLKQSSVLLVGAGGLGSPLATYLAAAGVGRLGLVDFDTIDLSNLQRQILYDTADVGRSKTELAAKRIRGINPHVTVETHDTRFDASNALELVARYDLVADGSDNFATRYLVNDACVIAGKRNVYGSIFRFEGQVSVFGEKGASCYRCLYPEPPPPGAVPSCAEGGVLGVLPGIIGTLQATEAIKLLLELGEPLVDRLLLFDALDMRFRELGIRKDPDCPVCGTTPSITTLSDEVESCESGPAGVTGIEPREAATRIAGGAVQLLDVRSSEEWNIAHLDGALHIPLGELPGRLTELEATRPVLVYCKTGGRAARAATLLAARGFADVLNLSGGIERWARDIDPTIPRY